MSKVNVVVIVDDFTDASINSLMNQNMNMMEIWDFDGTEYQTMIGFDYNGPYSDFMDVYTGETIIEPLDPFVMSEWGHGDQVAKALFEQLDNPNNTFV